MEVMVQKGIKNITVEVMVQKDTANTLKEAVVHLDIRDNFRYSPTLAYGLCVLTTFILLVVID